MSFFHLHKKRILGLSSPALFVVAAIVLLRFVTENPEQADAMARGIAGPITWPRFMLYGVILCAAGWFLQDLYRLLRAHLVLREDRNSRGRPGGFDVGDSGKGVASVAVSEKSGGSDLKVAIGLAIVLAYGFLIPILGFAIATFIFIVLWLILGGIHKPIQISLTDLIGTVILLYIFVKLSLMPLDRGQDIFGDLTLSLYQLLRIY